MAIKEFKGFTSGNDTWNCYDTNARESINSMGYDIRDLGNELESINLAVSALRTSLSAIGDDVDEIKDGTTIDSFADVESAITSQKTLLKDTVGWTGKNLLAGFKLGNINRTTGQEEASTTVARSINYIPVTAEEEYTISGSITVNLRVFTFNASKTFINSDDIISISSGIGHYTIPSGVAFVRFIGTASGIGSDMQFEKGSTVTSYEPYHASVEEEINRIDSLLDSLASHKIYGFHIMANESDPDNMVTYLADAVDATPAHMDYTTDKFDYGTWENAFFMPKPCMLKSDGTVAYYLNPNDYTKKADGTASDIADTSFDGNAMMEWGQGSKIWLKIVPDEHGEGASVFIANYQADEDFHDYSFHNSAGISVDHFYTPIYNGSVISNKMRSLSGQQVSKTLTGEAEITAAKLNNPTSDEMWNTECFADRLLINMLLILMGKNVDTQTVFGQGLNTSGSEAINDSFRTGVHNAKGLFYGTNSGAAATYTNAVKVFGMENWYGFQWRRIRGLILKDGAFMVKLTYGQEDGSTVTGYNTDGTGYKEQGLAVPSGTSGSYIISHSFTEDGMFPKAIDGSQTTYYCDAFWYSNSGARFALFGGNSNGGAGVGAFCLVLDAPVAYARWSRGAALSCKPLAQG